MINRKDSRWSVPRANFMTPLNLMYKFVILDCQYICHSSTAVHPILNFQSSTQA